MKSDLKHITQKTDPVKLYQAPCLGMGLSMLPLHGPYGANTWKYQAAYRTPDPTDPHLCRAVGEQAVDAIVALHYDAENTEFTGDEMKCLGSLESAAQSGLKPQRKVSQVCCPCAHVTG